MSKKSNLIRAPKIPLWILQYISETDRNYPASGDLEEIYFDMREHHGQFFSFFWLWQQVLRSSPVFLYQSFIWSFIMIRNYLKLGWRNITRHKGFSFINISGLTIGITCCIFILFWVQNELSYNQLFQNTDQIFRINKKYKIGNETSYNPATPYPLAQTTKTKFAEVLDATNYYRISALLKYEDKIFNERRVCVTDSSFFTVFSFQFLKGDQKTALSNPNSIVLTQAFAEKYFGDSDPIGKTVTLDNQKEFMVSGVIQNIPQNSDLQFDIFVPSFGMGDEQDNDNWGSHWLRTFVFLQKDTDTKNLENKLSALIQERLPEEKISLVLQPLNHLHLYTVDGKQAGMKYVYFFSIIAIFILTIACINFINLSTARLEKRAKEVGLRKVVGADRSQLIKQFFGESILFTLIALILAVFLIELLLPVFNNVTGKTLDIHYLNSSFLLGFIFIAIFTGLISGSYPAIYLSSFQPVKVLKGAIGQKSKNKFFTKSLVIIQFALSILLLISTGIIYKQLKFMQTKDLGFNKENILYMNSNSDIRKNYEVFKNELLQNQKFISITRTSELPTEIWSIMRGIVWEGKETPDGAAFGFAAIDYDFFKTMDIEIVQGRGFSKKFPADTSNYIFNEKAIEVMGMKNPIGKRFSPDENNSGTIIGIVKNFHCLPLTYEIEPMMIQLLPSWDRHILVKVRSDNLPETIKYAENVWHNLAPNYPFEYHFLDEQFEKIYGDELRAGEIFKYFVIIAIFISCLGLLGLASFTAEKRTKEIGVRKLLGASTSRIFSMLSVEFFKWVLIANIIAWPIAWFAMKTWLQNFTYRTPLSLWIFCLSGIIALVIALLTVSYQCIKSASANPIDSLKYE